MSLEDPLVVRGRDPDAVVANRNGDPVADRLHLEAYRPLLTELQGVR